MNNNYLENWFSLKWFTIEQLTSFEWENHLYLYLLFLIPIFYLLRNILVNKKTIAWDTIAPQESILSYDSFEFFVPEDITCGSKLNAKISIQNKLQQLLRLLLQTLHLKTVHLDYLFL